MKYLKALGVASLAAFAVMAFIGATTASAAKEPIVDATKFPVSFTGTGGAGVLETTNENKVNCTGSTSSGSISSENTAQNIVVKFTGCTGPLSSTCTTAGQSSGVIVTTALHGTLVYLEKGSSKAGILLKGTGGPSEEHFATFKCVGFLGINSTLTVTGTVVGELTNLNESTKTFVLHFSKDAPGHPTPNQYLSAADCSVVSTTESLLTSATGAVSFSEIGSAVEGTQTLTTSEAIKITSTSCS